MKNTDGKIAIIRKGENDLNRQEGTVFNPDYKQKNTVYLPEQILELSFIVRGEAGGGKTVFLDRLMKETVDAGHCVILHNVKGDELNKIQGYKSYYLIEPWTKHSWEIDFLNLCADKNEQAEDTKIRTLAEAFSKVPDEFFDKAGISVIEALLRCAIKSNKDKNGKVQATLKNVVDIWHSFNVQDDIVKVDMTDIQQVKKAVKQESEQLVKINQFLKDWFPTSSMYVDPKNEKTSLCVLASVIEIVRKFESLSKFWKDNSYEPNDKSKKRVFDVSAWINKKANDDKKVIILSNSNMFGDVANSYISAFINLTTTQLIDSNYKPVKEIHFILDEFVQLSSINLNNFLKLPDVGRGKQVRVKIALQRTSQVKSVWKDFDDKSFASAFQNKIWARYADDDKDNVRHEIGKNKLTIHKSTGSWSAQGQSSSNQTETKSEEVVNIDELQKELGPIKMLVNGKLTTLGVSILCNFSNCRALSIIKFPFVNFPKIKDKLEIKSNASAGNIKTSTEAKNDNKEELTKEINKNINYSLDTLTNQPTIEQVKQSTDEKYFGKTESIEEKSIGASVANDILAETLDHTGALSVALKVGEIIEGMENFTKNTNIPSSNNEITDDDLDKLIKEHSNNKNKEKSK